MKGSPPKPRSEKVQAADRLDVPRTVWEEGGFSVWVCVRARGIEVGTHVPGQVRYLGSKTWSCPDMAQKAVKIAIGKMRVQSDTYMRNMKVVRELVDDFKGGD